MLPLDSGGISMHSLCAPAIAAHRKPLKSNLLALCRHKSSRTERISAMNRGVRQWPVHWSAADQLQEGLQWWGQVFSLTSCCGLSAAPASRAVTLSASVSSLSLFADVTARDGNNLACLSGLSHMCTCYCTQ